MEYKFYLYRHVRKDNGVPFYVGIGTKPKTFFSYKVEYKRAYKKNDRGLLWERIANKNGYDVEIVIESNDYNYLLNQESFFINLYGRIDLGMGTLANHTNGGEGNPGRIWKPSIEHIKKVSESNRGRKMSDSHKAAIMYGRKNTPISNESRGRYRKAKSGTVHTEEQKRKNRIAHTGSNHYKSKKVINSETGEIFETIKEACQFYKIDYTTFIRYINNKVKSMRNETYQKLRFV